MTAPTASDRLVGVDLQESNEDNRRVAEAIQMDNPDVVLTHMPGLIRLQAPRRLMVSRDTVESLLGRPWETHEFQMSIVSYFGHIAEWDDDQIIIAWDH